MMGRSKSLLTAVLVVFAACHSSDRLGPATDSASNEDPQFAVAPPPGIVFASFALTPTQFNSVHTGAVRNISPSALLSYLSSVKAKNGRVLLNLAGDARNTDGTFSLTKWKAQIDRYGSLKFDDYIKDGTLIGNFLVDEPHYPSRWGGKIIPQATVEAMAKYSKQKWSTLTTVVNAPPTWLDDSRIQYDYLDAGWAMYMANMGSNTQGWAANQVKAAKSKGLGLFSGLNVLDGGNGSSGFSGNYPKKWAMSASELRKYGSAILSQTYVCGFAMWKYTSAYYDRPDIKTALAEISAMARKHLKTSCWQ